MHEYWDDFVNWISPPPANVPGDEELSLLRRYTGLWGAKVLWLAVLTLGPLFLQVKIPQLALSISTATFIYASYHILGMYVWVQFYQLNAMKSVYTAAERSRTLNNLAWIDRRFVKPLSWLVLFLLLATVVTKARFLWGRQAFHVKVPTLILRILGAEEQKVGEEPFPVEQKVPAEKLKVPGTASISDSKSPTVAGKMGEPNVSSPPTLGKTAATSSPPATEKPDPRLPALSPNKSRTNSPSTTGVLIEDDKKTVLPSEAALPVQSANDLVKTIQRISMITSAEERIEQIQQTLSKSLMLSSAHMPGVAIHINFLYLALAGEYEQLHNQQKAKITLEQQLVFIEQLLKKGDAFPRNVPPVGIWFSRNRIRWVYVLIAEHYCDLPTEERVEARKNLILAVEALRGLSSCSDQESLAHAGEWIELSFAFLANSDIQEARSALEDAIRLTGIPSAVNAELAGRRSFFQRFFLLYALIEAESGDPSKATKCLDNAVAYFDEADDVNGIVGHTRLLISRIAQDDASSTKLVDTAIAELRSGDLCESCRYNIACALSRKAEHSEGVAKSEIIRESVEHLVWVLSRAKLLQLEIDTASIQKDPYLKMALTDPIAVKALAEYEWLGDPFVIPPGVPIWQSEAWHTGVPLRCLRFSRVNSVP